MRSKSCTIVEAGTAFVARICVTSVVHSPFVFSKTVARRETVVAYRTFQPTLCSVDLDAMIFELDVLLGVEFASWHVALKVASARCFVLQQVPFPTESTSTADAL